MPPPPKKQVDHFFGVGLFQGPVFAGGSRDILTRSQLEGPLKTGSFDSILQAKFLFIISKLEVLKLLQELWGHIFVGHIGIPIVCLICPPKTSHKMTAMMMALSKETTLHGKWYF